MKGFFLSRSGVPFASSSFVNPIWRRPVRDSMIFSSPSNAPPHRNRMSLVLTWMYSCCGRKHPQQEYIQVNTKDILFLCGGAFDGLEKIIESRTGRRQIGFTKEELAKGTPERLKKNPFIDVEPDDLLRYGLIPELVGRLPVAVPLDALDEDALMRILVEPKNALTKQYQKLFELEDVRLSIEKDALKAIAQKALKRGTGARGLRAILEEMMTDIMFDLPSRDDVREVAITAECVTDGRQPHSAVMATSRTSSRLGRSNMMSVIISSRMARRPRAPVPRLSAFCAMALSASFSMLSRTSSSSNSFWYCLVSAFLGSTRMRIRASSSRASSGTATGSRPTSSGIRP